MKLQDDQYKYESTSVIHLIAVQTHVVFADVLADLCVRNCRCLAILKLPQKQGDSICNYSEREADITGLFWMAIRMCAIAF